MKKTRRPLSTGRKLSYLALIAAAILLVVFGILKLIFPVA